MSAHTVRTATPANLAAQAAAAGLLETRSAAITAAVSAIRIVQGVDRQLHAPLALLTNPQLHETQSEMERQEERLLSGLTDFLKKLSKDQQS